MLARILMGRPGREKKTQMADLFATNINKDVSDAG